MFLPCFGMVQNEPPQLPPPPGIEAMSHLPDWSGAVSWMWPIIHAGQARTANWSFLKPWSQLGWKLARLAERPASIAFMLTSNATFGPPSICSFSLVSKKPTGCWASTGLNMLVPESTNFLPDLATYCLPTLMKSSQVGQSLLTESRSVGRPAFLNRSER